MVSVTEITILVTVVCLVDRSIAKAWAEQGYSSRRNENQARPEIHCTRPQENSENDPCKATMCQRGSVCEPKQMQGSEPPCRYMGVCIEKGNCDDDVDEGIACGGTSNMWYYDSETWSCRPFNYKGCGGNSNNFHSQEVCRKACVRREVCSMAPEEGPCRASIPRFYYDAMSGTCKHFRYGGCEGNHNRFRTESECYTKCNDNNTS